MKDSCSCCNGKYNPLALMLGTLMALAHLVWLILVGANVAKPAVDWILKLHHVQFEWSVLTFSWGHAVGLVVLTFGVGYILGMILSGLWCLFGGCNCKK